MLKHALLGSTVELDFWLDGEHRDTWSVVEESGDSAVYACGRFQVRLSVAHRAPRAGLLSFKIEKEGGAAFGIQKMHISVRSPLRDLHRIWVPHMLLEGTLERVTLSAGGASILSCANRALAFVSALNRYGRNRVSVGLLDQALETEVRGGGAADEGRNRIVEFIRPLPGISLRREAYEDTVYVSEEDVSWYDAMAGFARYHEQANCSVAAPRHPDADQPLYCTWYAHGPFVTQEKIEAEIQTVRDLGFKNYIIDEGWFGRLPDPHTYRGDYTPDANRFPDFRAMVDRMHRIGLNVILWVSPFQVNKNCSRYQELKPYLTWWNTLGEAPYFMGVMYPWVNGEVNQELLSERMELCPRTGFTETYVPELVARLMRDYELDGLKIDFLDQIMVMPCRAGHQHIHDNLGDAVMKTVTAMVGAIRKVKRDAIVEFRPPYANVALQRFATLYRAQDCPWDVDMNRRLCSWMKAFTPQPGPLVVADYLTFPPAESDINIAKSLAAIVLYSVPSIAEKVLCLPADRTEMLRNWIAFYTAHRRELTGGRWQPLEYDPHYSTISIEGDNETFIGLFKDCPGEMELARHTPDRIYVVNATAGATVHTRLRGIAGEYAAASYDHFLHKDETRGAVERTARGLEIDMDVPEGGMLCLERVDDMEDSK